jgi:hypothetical protein
MRTPFEQLRLNSPASEGALADLVDNVGIPMPNDYIEFLRVSNGATGTGPDIFVNLKPAEEVLEATRAYGASEFWPGLVVIGGDGLGNIIAIDGRQRDPMRTTYIVLDPVWLDPDSESCQHRSNTLRDVLVYLAGV